MRIKPFFFTRMRNKAKFKGHALPFFTMPEFSSGRTYTKQFVFYKAGKCLVQTLLLDHPKISLLKLTESKNNVVSSIQDLSSIETRTNLKSSLTGFYAGKASELFTGYPKMEVYQPFSSFKKKNQITQLQQRKNWVCVNGLFANKITLQAKINPHNQTELLQITYTCDTLCAVLPKQSLRNSAKLKNSVVERSSWINNVLPLRYSLLHEQYNAASVYNIRRSRLCKPKQSFGYQNQGFDGKLMHNFAPAKRLNCAKIEQFLCQSDIGLLERIKATFLVQSLIINGSIFSSNILNLQKNSIVGHLNKTEIKDKKVFTLFQNLEEQIRNVYFEKDISNLTSSYKKGLLTKQNFVTEPLGIQAFQSMGAWPYVHLDEILNDISGPSTNTLLSSRKINVISQKNEINALCEEIVCKSLTFSIKPYGHWFRIYLPQVESHQGQPVSADQFFKRSRELSFFEYTKTNLLQMDFATNLRNLIVPGPTDVSIALPSLSYTSTRKSFSLHKRVYKNEIFAQTPFYMQRTHKVSKRLKVRTQVELSPRLNLFTQTIAHAWPRELGYGMSHNIVLNTFSRAFHLIGKNRELLDVLADHLIRFEKIRIPEIVRICSLYVDTLNVFATPVGPSFVITRNRT